MANITIDEHGVPVRQFFQPSKELWFFVAFTPQSCWVFWVAAGVIKLGGFNGKIMGKPWEDHGKIPGKCGNIMGKCGQIWEKPWNHIINGVFFGGEKHRKTWLVDLSFPFAWLITDGNVYFLEILLQRATRYVNGVTTNVVNLGVNWYYWTIPHSHYSLTFTMEGATKKP